MDRLVGQVLRVLIPSLDLLPQLLIDLFSLNFLINSLMAFFIIGLLLGCSLSLTFNWILVSQPLQFPSEDGFGLDF